RSHERGVPLGYSARLSELEQGLRSKRTVAAGPWIELQRRGQFSRLSDRWWSDKLSGVFLQSADGMVLSRVLRRWAAIREHGAGCRARAPVSRAQPCR